MAHREHDTASAGSLHARHANPYRRLATMGVLSFIAMYLLMFAMVDRLNNVVMNVNQVYMAALMTAPMVLIEIALMRSMYADRRRNAVIAAAMVVLGILSWHAIRRQTAVGDRQFARSMIPHHASAILMCKQASITSPELRALCGNSDGIVATQEREIRQMNEFLRARP